MERLLFGVNMEEVTSFTVGVINQQLQFKSKVVICTLTLYMSRMSVRFQVYIESRPLLRSHACFLFVCPLTLSFVHGV
jgi:hypothetical protein